MLKKALSVLTLVSLSACAGMQSPIPGSMYADVHSKVAATSNQAGNRVGESCGSSILGLVATGDASIEAARRNGGITMISSVDDTVSNILGIYAKYCTTVRGR